MVVWCLYFEFQQHCLHWRQRHHSLGMLHLHLFLHLARYLPPKEQGGLPAEQSRAEIASFTLSLTPPVVISSNKLWNLNNEDRSTGKTQRLIGFIPRLLSVMWLFFIRSMNKLEHYVGLMFAFLSTAFSPIIFLFSDLLASSNMAAALEEEKNCRILIFLS